MKGFKKVSNNSVYVNLVGMFLIFITFMGLAFMILTMELEFYNKIKVGIDNTFNKGMVISYLNNKIHSYDGKSIVLLESETENNMMVLEDKDTKLKTYIYVKDGYMYECVIGYDEEFNNYKGQRLFEVSSLKVEKEDSIYKFVINEGKDTEMKSYTYAR